MSRTGWLAIVAATGLAIGALSLVDAWIVHDRVLSGEGYRDVLTMVDAWRSVALPVLGLGVAVGVVTAIGAVLAMRRPSLDGLLPLGAAISLALIGAVLVPLGQRGLASRIDLTPGWAAMVGVALATLMVVAALRVARPSRSRALGLAMLLVLLLPAAAGGRWIGLQAHAGSNQAWSDGTYVRAATGELPEATLVIEDGRFRLADRWAGAWEGLDRNVSLDDDPSCPGSRGTYHAHGNPQPLDPDLRFVKIIDTCADGARAEVLTTGIWERQ